MALSAGVVWEVRSTATNGDTQAGGGFDPSVGAPGTDYSQQDAAQVSYTDLVIDAATNTKLTSAGTPFTSAHVGNVIRITAGTGFTTGFYTVNSVAASVATMDRAVGTIGSTGGTGYLGGGFLTPGQALSVAVQSNTVYVKKGTAYALSSTANVAGGRITITVGGNSGNVPFQLIGYDTNRTLQNTDTPPQLDAGASMASATVQMIFCNSNYIRVRNFKLRNPNSYAGGSVSTMLHQNGVYNLAERIDIDGNTVNGWYGVFQGGTQCHLRDVHVQHIANQVGISMGGPTCSATASSSRNNTCAGFSGGGRLRRCIAYNNTGAASDGFNTTSSAGASLEGCVAYGNGRDGFKFYFDTAADNCIAVGNAGWGYNVVTASSASIATLYNCASYNNTSGGNTGLPSWALYNFTTLSGDPFTNAASGDFSLNATAGAGASCKAAGYPASFYTLSTTSYLDLGVAQSNASSTIYIPMSVPRIIRTTRTVIKNRPPGIIQTPATLVVVTKPPRVITRPRYPQRRPPGIIPGANILVPLQIPAPPRVIRYRQMYPRPIKVPLVPGLVPPAVVVSRPPRIQVRTQVRHVARGPVFIGAAGSGTVVLEENATVYRFDPGATGKSVYFKLRDSTTGQAKKSLTTASPGANAGYVREQGTSVNIPLVQLASAADAWTSGGFIEVDPVNSPGEYRLDMPNAALAAGSDFAVATLVFTNAFDSSVLIRLEKSVSNLGPGAISWTIQVNNTQTSLPLAGALVWITTDQAGSNVVAGVLPTNAQGQATFLLNAGSYYAWVSDPGYTGTNPTALTVS